MNSKMDVVSTMDVSANIITNAQAIAGPSTHVASHGLNLPFDLNSTAEFPNLPITNLTVNPSITKFHTCTICSRQFNHKGHFNRHLKIHQKAALLPPVARPSSNAELHSIAGPSTLPSAQTGHVCTICSKTFAQKFNLNKHMKTHSEMKDFTCETCHKSFSTNSNLVRHIVSHQQDPTTYECPICGKMFGRRDNLQHHLDTHLRTFLCPKCDESFNTKQNLVQHLKVTHPLQKGGAQPAAANSPAPKRRKVAEKVRDVFATHLLFPSEVAAGDLLVFLREMHDRVKVVLDEELMVRRAIKWYVVSKIRFSRKTDEDETEYATPYFRSKAVVELEDSIVEEHLQEAFAKIKISFDEFLEGGSGWALDEIIHLEVKIATYHPLSPRSYFRLPNKLALKNAVLNIQNEDNKCFVWSVLAALHPIGHSDHPERVSNYLEFEQELKMGSVTCPVPPCKVRFIEMLNDLRINVYGYEDDEVLPLYISKREDEQVINLLYISSEKKQHYCLIRNMSRLLGNLTKHNGQSFYCYSCLHRFAKEETLKAHTPYCNDHAPQRIRMPTSKDCILQFKQYRSSLKVPYIIYADFEALIEKLDNPMVSSTQNTATHIPCGYAYVIVDSDGKCVKPIKVYRGLDAVDNFITSIIAEKDELARKLIAVTPMVITAQDQIIIDQATHCGLCKGWLGEDRVRDHDHLTGQFRQVLHNECNLAFRLRKMIPCVFHNLKNYDAHLIMQGLGKLQDHEISVIPTTMEKYISFSVTKKLDKVPITLQFLDSLQFLNTSLQKLVDNLERDKFSILKSSISSNHDLLLKKGVYPYEYMSSFSRFEEKSLPPQSAFYSSLSNAHISAEDYAHAHAVWKTFNIANLGEYHDLYVKTDVLLLADIFENFRRLTLDFYQLDAAQMMTSPGLAWQAALKMSDVKLDLFTDIEMHLFIERGIRGGVSVISHRHSEANHLGCPNYNSAEKNRHIMYLDANNLYGWAMSQSLPIGDFRWEDPETTPIHDVINQPDDSDEGFILEVDLEYPVELHDNHNLYPLAPERLIIKPDMLSPTAMSILQEMDMKPAPSCEKLVPNLKPKTNYVLHYRNLKLYLSLGLKLVKVHRILKFSQQPWLKDYINFNTEQRKLASTSFEKDFFKLLNNAVFGKTMENLRNRVDIQLVNNPQKAKRLVASPAFHAFTEFSNHLVAVQRHVKSLTLNRPIYAGFTILELSKVLMYQFHYNVILKKYGSNAKLLFTDTDSLTYELTTPDLIGDMKELKNFFDFSDYSIDHPLYDTSNKKKLGFFKDELNGKSGFEFIGLRSKMYSILSEEGSKQTAKGISRTAAKQQLKHENYRDCLFNRRASSVVQHRIGSKKHVIFSMQQTKRALSAFDDKRYLLEDGITSYAYGHYKIT